MKITLNAKRRDPLRIGAMNAAWSAFVGILSLVMSVVPVNAASHQTNSIEGWSVLAA